MNAYLESSVGERIELTENKVTIGRSVGNTIVLADITISRNHCKLEKLDEQWVLTDTSSNGTNVNKNITVKGKQHWLSNGDTIALSQNSEFQFHCPMLMDDISVFEIDDAIENSIVIVTDSDTPEKALVEALVPNAETNESLTTPPVDSAPIVIEPEPVDNKPATNNKSSNNGNNIQPTSSMDDMEVQSNVENELTCSICTELFIKANTLNCSHTFCQYCITIWRKSHKDCPLCRKSISVQLASVVIDNTIDRLLENQSASVRESRKAAVEERAKMLDVQKPGSKKDNSVIYIDLDEDDEDEEDDEDFDDFDDYDDDDYMYDSDDYYGSRRSNGVPYNGVPGVAYGGYGRCYNCGETGHWSNGCPNRRRRRNR